MAKCKDCLHMELCARDERLTEFSPEQEALCVMFADRSRYVLREKGEWKPKLEYDFDVSEDVVCGFHCSLCGAYFPYVDNFCPNCGADMRGDIDGKE